MPDRTLRYMSRFKCIGPDCEDNCCHGWQVDVDPRTYDRLIKVTALTSAIERKRLKRALQIVRKDRRERRLIRMKPDGNCPMLEDNGFCHIQSTFGEKLLPDVCATYPRSVQMIGEDIELSGMPSCPEVSRQLLHHEDAIEEMTFEREILPRQLPQGGMDPRDIRPYWRLMLDVRSFLLQLLRDETRPLAERLFFMAWFGKRTAKVLNRNVMKADHKPVFEEMALLREEKNRDEIGRRFGNLEVPSALVLLVARELVRDSGNRARDSFRDLVESCFASYVDLAPLLPDGAPPAALPLERVWADYRSRRDRVRAREAARVDRYLKHGTANYWMHHLPLGSPDLQVHMLRLLALMAVWKLLLFSHPKVAASLDAPGDELGRALDLAAVEVFYRTARHIEHSSLLANLESALAKKELASIAGAVHLIRF